jgi:hypothetical protein
MSVCHIDIDLKYVMKIKIKTDPRNKWKIIKLEHKLVSFMKRKFSPYQQSEQYNAIKH